METVSDDILREAESVREWGFQTLCRTIMERDHPGVLIDDEARGRSEADKEASRVNEQLWTDMLTRYWVDPRLFLRKYSGAVLSWSARQIVR